MSDQKDYSPCMRTLAIFKPGVPLPGVRHSYAWSGKVPCTGSLRCTLCGKVIVEEKRV
jgi:hypothetical protein